MGDWLAARRPARLLATHHPAGPDPDGEGDIFATLLRRGEPRGRADRRRPGGARIHRLLLPHRAGRPLRRPRIRLLCAGPAQVRPVLARAARPHTSSPTSPATTASSNVRCAIIGDETGPARDPGVRPLRRWADRVAVAGPVASPRRDGAARACRPGAQQPVPGPARPGHRCAWPLTSAMIGAMSRRAQPRVVRGTSQGRLRLQPAPRLRRRVRLQPAVETVGRLPGDLRLAARGAPWPAQLHRGLDVGVPNLILRSDHSVTEASDAAAMQCGDAVLDVTQIARWAGCIGNRTTIVPVADAKHDVFLSMPQPRQVGLSRAGHAGWMTTWARPQRRRAADRLKGANGDGELRPRDHRNGFGQQHSRRPLRRQADRDLRAGHVRRHLPQRRAASPPRCSSTPPRSPRRSAPPRVTASTHTSTGCAGTTSSRACSAASTRSRSAARTTGARNRTSTSTTAHPFRRVQRRRPLPAAHRGRRGVHRRTGGDRRGRAGDDSAGHLGLWCALLHQRHHHADPRTAETSGDRRRRLRGSEFAHVFSALGVRVTIVIRGGWTAAASATTPLSSGSPASRRANGSCAATAISSARTRARSGIVLELDDGSDAAAPTPCWWPPAGAQRRSAGRRTGRHRPRATGRSSSTNTNGPPRVTFSRSATCRRHMSSSTSPTTKPASCSAICCATGTTPKRWSPPTIAIVPAAVFTDPQIAYIGLTENEAVAQGFDVSCKIQDYADVAYGWATEDTTGIVKLIADSADRPTAWRAHHGTPSLVDHPAADSGDDLRPDRARRWRAASTGSTRRCRRSSRTRCWAAMRSAPGPRAGIRALASADTGHAASGRPLRQARRNCPRSRVRAPTELTRGHLNNRAALGADRVVVRDGGQPIGGDPASRVNACSTPWSSQGGDGAVVGRQRRAAGRRRAGMRAAAGGSRLPAGAR